MPAWLWPAAGAAAGLASSLYGDDNQKQKVDVDPFIQGLRSNMIAEATGIPVSAWGYGPHRVFAGPSPATEQLSAAGIGRAGTPAPYERAAGDYATRAVTGGNLYSNPAMVPLSAYGMGAGGMPLWSGPGRAMMMGTAAGSGYSNPYLDAMVTQAQRRTGANVASMFGGRGMGGSSLETQLAAREMGDLASRMYGQAYEAERGRQTAMQQALGGLETGRLGLGVQQRGQSIGAATTLGQLFGQERGLQQEAAFNVPTLTAADFARLQAGLGMARGLEGYGERQRGEDVAAWQRNALAPMARVQGILGAFSGLPTGSTTTVQSPGLNPITAGLGGALAGYGLYRMGDSDGAGDQTNPYRTGVGGGFGGFGPPGFPNYGNMEW